MDLAELNLQERIAIVTGAGRGIGRAIALALAERGADLALCSRTESELRSVEAELRAMGRRTLVLPTDVSRSEEVDRLVERTVEAFGKIDILVNNAGRFQKHPVVPLPGRELAPPRVPEPISGILSDEAWSRVLEVNLNGPFYCCRAVAPQMLRQRYGKIINVSSNSAVQGAPYVAAYNCSKAALNMLTRVLALEWAEYGVRVNALAPGEFHTSLTDFSWSDPHEKRRRLERIPMHSEGSLRHLGLLAAYLASPATDYMTGQILHLDGGLTAR